MFYERQNYFVSQVKRKMENRFLKGSFFLPNASSALDSNDRKLEGSLCPFELVLFPYKLQSGNHRSGTFDWLTCRKRFRGIYVRREEKQRIRDGFLHFIDRKIDRFHMQFFLCQRVDDIFSIPFNQFEVWASQAEAEVVWLTFRSRSEVTT